MIQDIFPHIYHNEYHSHAPKDNDIILVFDGNEVLLKTDDKTMFSFAEIKEQVKCETAEYRYLFEIDETAFYYLRNADVTTIQGVSRYSKNIFRTYEPRYLAFAGITW